MKKKIAKISVLVLILMAFSGCSSKINETAVKTEDTKIITEGSNNSLEKPSKITMMTHTFTNNMESLEAIEKRYRENTGINLEINQVQTSDYYEQVNIEIAINNVADLIEVGSVFYPAYSMYDLLWDMSDTYEKSSLKGRVNETFVDAIRINGKLYGFPLSKGNGTITYIRKAWLDELNIAQPKDYDEFINMLRAFKRKGENIIPITAAGFINSEHPYTTYLPEFYQDANPDIYLKNGKYIDGMQEEAMRQALLRMRDAYSEGLIDKDIINNKTSTCRDKFYEGIVGCFNYWAGNWSATLENNLKNLFGEDGEIVAIKPIKETKYIQRPPLALVIPKSCENPEAVFKYLIEYSLDGGEGQNLFTYGVEGISYPLEVSEEYVLKNSYYTPELNYNNYKPIMPIKPIIQETNDMMEQNSILMPLPVTSKASGSMLPELNAIRKETIEDVVTGKMTVDEGMQEYEKRASKMVIRVLNDLNSSLEAKEGK